MQAEAAMARRLATLATLATATAVAAGAPQAEWGPKKNRWWTRLWFLWYGWYGIKVWLCNGMKERRSEKNVMYDCIYRYRRIYGHALSIYLSVYLSIYLPLHPFYLSIHLPIYLLIYPYIYPASMYRYVFVIIPS